jgi:hypothetical protein
MAPEKGERSNGVYGRNRGAAEGRNIWGRGSRTTPSLSRSGRCALSEWCCYVLDRAEPWVYGVASILVVAEMVPCSGRTMSFVLDTRYPRLGERIGLVRFWGAAGQQLRQISRPFGSLAPPGVSPYRPVAT